MTGVVLNPPHFFEDLYIGQSASYSRTVTRDDISGFADISGDINPLHLDEDYAAQTFFKGCIAHGMLSASFISTVFGTQLPGPGAIYISQNLRFLSPVRAGDTVLTRVTVKELIAEKTRAVFECECLVGGRHVITGEAVLIVPRRTRQAA